MPTIEILKKVGLLPSTLYIGGVLCMGILALIVIYHIIVFVVRVVNR